MGIPGSVAARGIDARGANDGGLRRRQSPESKRGKHDETTRVRFKGVGASPGFKESVSGVGLDGAAPRFAGDERRSSGAGGNGGEAVPGGDGAREWFGEVLGSSRTVVARGIGEGAHGGAQSGAAAAKQSNGGATRLGGRASNRTARGLSKMMQMARIWARSSPAREEQRWRRGGSRGEVVATAGRGRAAGGRQQRRGCFERGGDETRGEGAGFIGEEERSVWRRETDIGGQGSSAGVHGRQRRFRGQCESGDGVDALGSEGGGSSGGNRTAGVRAGAVKESELAWSVKRRRGSDTGSGREREKEGEKGAWSLAIMRRGRVRRRRRGRAAASPTLGRGLGMYQGKLKEESWKRFKRNTWVFVLGNIGWSQGKDSRRDLNNSGFVEVFGEDSKEGFEFQNFDFRDSNRKRNLDEGEDFDFDEREQRD
uniref:Epstein-Barr virus EBNA-1-like n=1 Tax=Oryza sativa subsp. japonica TaxID=39947 RepID=Q5Z5A6_ORYSJ|nr:Epstein-Barr virus EBNA-1-like [Oryza sativa Japonica Group]